jgi:hypothetical protein
MSQCDNGVIVSIGYIPIVPDYGWPTSKQFAELE